MSDIQGEHLELIPKLIIIYQPICIPRCSNQMGKFFTRVTNLLLRRITTASIITLGYYSIFYLKTTILLVAPDPPSRGKWDIWGRCRRWRSGSMYGSVLTYAVGWVE